MDHLINEKGTIIMEQLKRVLENAQDSRDWAGDGTYQAYLHGQASGLFLALKIMFPEDGDLGEQASTLVIPVLGEKKCDCHHHDMEEGS